jgi:hypothetical protein
MIRLAYMKTPKSVRLCMLMGPLMLSTGGAAFFLASRRGFDFDNAGPFHVAIWIFYASYTIFVIAMIFFIVRKIGGSYKDINPASWRDQLW